MATLAQFAVSMKKLAAQVESGANMLKRKAALAALQAVIVGTPVGNPVLWKRPKSAREGYAGGRARANWFVGINAAVHTVTEQRDPGGQSALAAGQAAIDRANPGEAIHLTNNVPYIIPLNDGHSKQAPAGFIETAVAEAVAVIGNSKVLG